MLGLPTGVSYDAPANVLRITPAVTAGVYTLTQRVTVNKGASTEKTDARTIVLTLVAAAVVPTPTPATPPVTTPEPVPVPVVVVVPTAIQGTVVNASYTANSTLFRATVVDSAACVANGPCVLSISADGNETSLGNDGRPIFELYQASANRMDVVFTSDYAQVTAGTKKLTLLATAGGTTIKRLVDGIQVAADDPSPVAPAGSAFANLADMSRGDDAGFFPITPVNAGGVTDPLGRAIVYSATGLPTAAQPQQYGVPITINASTGIISGTYDASGNEPFTVTVTARPTGSTKSISKTFVLTILDQG